MYITSAVDLDLLETGERALDADADLPRLALVLEVLVTHSQTLMLQHASASAAAAAAATTVHLHRSAATDDDYTNDIGGREKSEKTSKVAEEDNEGLEDEENEDESSAASFPEERDAGGGGAELVFSLSTGLLSSLRSLQQQHTHRQTHTGSGGALSASANISS